MMYELSQSEVSQVSGGTTFENWQTIALGTAAPTLAMTLLDLLVGAPGSTTANLTTTGLNITLPTAVIAGLIVGGFELYDYMQKS